MPEGGVALFERIRASFRRRRKVDFTSKEGEVSLVSIRSANSTDGYVRVDGRNVQVAPGKKPPGTVGGIVDCRSSVGPLETLKMIGNKDGTVSFQVSSLDNVFLRLDAKGMRARATTGGGVVNCERGAGDLTKFRVELLDDGSRAIASVASPGVYLRVDPNARPNKHGGFGLVNCQFGIGATEKLSITVSDDATALNHQDIETAIQKYAPLVRFHPQDQYAPCSVEWLLQRCSLYDSKTKSTVVHPTADDLPKGVQEDKRYWLILDEGAKGGDLSSAKAYVHAYWNPGMPYTDLQFWFFFAYNGHARAHVSGLEWTKVVHEGDISLDPLGEHFGDWEYCVVRIDNTSKRMTSIGLSQHGVGHFFNESQFGRFEFQGTNPIVYSSLNGHANYSAAETSKNKMAEYKIPPVAIPAGIEFWLRNDTAVGGPVLECSRQYQVVQADWLNGPDAYHVPAWLQYCYRWGPEGTVTNLNPNAVGDIIAAAAGPTGVAFNATVIQLLVGEIILPFFIKSNVNGSAAPQTQSSWNGIY